MNPKIKGKKQEKKLNIHKKNSKIKIIKNLTILQRS